MRRAALVSALLVLLLGPARPAEAGGLQAEQAARERALVEKLDALATWCTKKRLFGKRDETYAQLLAFDGEHETARRKLRYAKGDDGAWVQDERFKPGTNWNRAALTEYERRLGALLAEHDTALLALWGRAEAIDEMLWARRQLLAYAHRAPGDERAGPLLRALSLNYLRAVLEVGLATEMAQTATLLRSLYPEDVEVRAALREVRHAGRWMMVEVARTVSGAAAIDTAAQEALDTAGAFAPAPLTEVERGIALPWQEGAALADVRVVGTARTELLRAIALHAQAAGRLFEHALRTTPSRREGLTIYVFAAKDEIDTFLAKYPVMDNASLRQRKELGLDLVFPDGYSMALKDNPPDAQIDLAVNTVLNQIFSDTFLESESPQGWHAEGISRYLAFKLLGTRLSINVVGRYAGQGKDRHVPESKESWLAQAHGLLRRSPKTGLPLMLGKGLDAFDERDAVISYAFAVYLIEGHDGLAPVFVRTLAKNADLDRTCREILGLALPIVEHRFRTWLDAVTVPTPEGAEK